jgi:thioredoxin 1
MQKIQNLEQIPDGIVVLKFEADWCGPCAQMSRTVNQLELEFPLLQFLVVDIDENVELVKKFQIKKIPALVILKNGVEQERVIGASLITPLRTLFKKYGDPDDKD